MKANSADAVAAAAGVVVVVASGPPHDDDDDGTLHAPAPSYMGTTTPTARPAAPPQELRPPMRSVSDG